LWDDDRRKRSIAEDLFESTPDLQLNLSFQVVQEVLNNLTKGPAPRAHPDEVERILESVLLPFWRVMPSEGLYRRALDLKERYRFAFYDSLIIAAALEANCTRLYSEDLQHGQRIERLTIINPFL
jgi:predicted nucleic acid-binding protein